MLLKLPGDCGGPPISRTLVRGGVWCGGGEVPEHLAKLGVRASGKPHMPVKAGGTNSEHGRKGAEATKRKRGKR